MDPTIVPTCTDNEPSDDTRLAVFYIVEALDPKKEMATVQFILGTSLSPVSRIAQLTKYV